MKKFFKIILVYLFFFKIFAYSTQNYILTGTSILTSLVNDITYNIKEFETITLVPPLQCPASFDLKPDDARKIKQARIIILHSFQQGYIEKIKKINKKAKIEIFPVGDLTIFSNYTYGLYEMKRILSKYYAGYEEKFEKNLNEKRKKIADKISPDLKYINDVLKKRKYKVLCSKNQLNFVKWLGFDIVSAFEGPDRMSAGDIMDIIKIAKEKKVKFIIGNLAGNHNETAKIFANDLKIPVIVLSNFPDETKNESLFLNLWEYNFSEIKKHIK